MKKFKFKSLAVSLFILCGIGGAANLYKDELIHFFTNNDDLNDTNDNKYGEELIEGDSFLSYGVIKGLKNVEYIIRANVEPINHTSPVTWSCDYPEYVIMKDNGDDSVTISRIVDYTGYVNIKASIDGLEANCKVYSVGDIKYKEVKLSDKTNSLNHEGYFYDSYDQDKNSLQIIVQVDITHDYLEFDYIANDGLFSRIELSDLINATSNINLQPLQFLKLSEVEKVWDLNETEENYERYNFIFEYNNASYDIDWEFSYRDYDTVICGFIEYISAYKITLDYNELIV